jgi:hypothetical protein
MSQAIGSYPERHEEAAGLAERAVATLAPLGHDEWTGWAWARLGIEQHRLRRLEEARANLLRSLEIRRGKPCAECASYALASLGAVLADLNESEAAKNALSESLGLALRHGNQTLLFTVLLGLADIGRRFGGESASDEAILRLIGAAQAVWHRHGLSHDGAVRTAIASWLDSMRRTLGDDAADRALAAGALLSGDDLLAEVDRLPVGARRVEFERWPALLDALGSIE